MWNLLQASTGFEASALAVLTRYENWTPADVVHLAEKAKLDARDRNIHALFDLYVTHTQPSHLIFSIHSINQIHLPPATLYMGEGHYELFFLLPFTITTHSQPRKPQTRSGSDTGGVLSKKKDYSNDYFFCIHSFNSSSAQRGKYEMQFMT